MVTGPLFAAGDFCLHIFQWVVRKRFAKCPLLPHHLKNNYSGGAWDGVFQDTISQIIAPVPLTGTRTVFLFPISPHCGNPAFVPNMDGSCSEHQGNPGCSHLLWLLASTRWETTLELRSLCWISSSFFTPFLPHPLLFKIWSWEQKSQKAKNCSIFFRARSSSPYTSAFLWSHKSTSTNTLWLYAIQ